MMRKKTVSLSFLADQLEEVFDGWSQYYNVVTCEVESLPDGGNDYVDFEEFEETAEKIDSSDEYVRLPGQWDIHEYNIMEAFAEEKDSSRLFHALRGRKPYRHFKDAVNELGIAQEYYDFRHEAYIDICREWCEDNDIPYEDTNASKSSDEPDNATPLNASEYDSKLLSMIPYFDQFHKNTLDVIKTCDFPHIRWLDLGCGTGTLEMLASSMFDGPEFVMLDVSESMLEQARAKCANLNAEFICGSSADIEYDNEFDVITAIQSNHYLHRDERERAVKGAYRALKDGGIFITFEIITVEDDAVHDLEFKRWAAYEMEHGRSEEAVREHLARAGVNYFPITVKEHEQLLKETGFSHVRCFWTSYMVMGMYGIK